MTSLRVVVGEDEPLLRADLVRLLDALPGVEVVGEGRNGLDVLDLVDAVRPDALFLDIRMPALDGLAVVRELDPATAPVVVFVTSHDEYALQAFDAHAVDYLMKPFDPARLSRAVERVRTRLASARTDELARLVGGLLQHADTQAPAPLRRIAARGVGKTILLDTSAIHWIEASDNYVRLHTAAGAHLSRRTMRDLEQLLDPTAFARVHRSTIVALAHVKELRPLGDGDQELLLRDGTRLVLTRSYRDAFLQRFGGVA
jgi:two-component system LytT family response regulator